VTVLLEAFAQVTNDRLSICFVQEEREEKLGGFRWISNVSLFHFWEIGDGLLTGRSPQNVQRGRPGPTACPLGQERSKSSCYVTVNADRLRMGEHP
jgi:hypothetical protein